MRKRAPPRNPKIPNETQNSTNNLSIFNLGIEQYSEEEKKNPTRSITNPAIEKLQIQKRGGSMLHRETQKFQKKPKIKPTTLFFFGPKTNNP